MPVTLHQFVSCDASPPDVGEYQLSDRGVAVTVTVAVAMHPVAARIYDTSKVPAESPVTLPVAEPTFATDEVPEAQAPPEVASVRGR